MKYFEKSHRPQKGGTQFDFEFQCDPCTKRSSKSALRRLKPNLVRRIGFVGGWVFPLAAILNFEFHRIEYVETGKVPL